MLTRRRFLTITAATVAGPARADPVTWRGRALGAEATLKINGPFARQSLRAVHDALMGVEASFSLFNPNSALSRLNTTGHVAMTPDFQRLWPQVVETHALTGGLFDPTIQSHWQALKTGQPEGSSASLASVQRRGATLTLPKTAALTLNGIAQGYATDRIFHLLQAIGFTGITVNIGEFRTDRLDALVGIRGLERNIACVSLGSGAIATSSPGALRVAGRAAHPSSLGF